MSKDQLGKIDLDLQLLTLAEYTLFIRRKIVTISGYFKNAQKYNKVQKKKQSRFYSLANNQYLRQPQLYQLSAVISKQIDLLKSCL